MNKKILSALVIASATLVACGGGDSGSAPATPPQSPLSPMAGVWVSPCGTHEYLSRTSDGAALQTYETIHWAVQGNQLSGTFTTRIFESADCTGPARAEQVATLTATFDGAVTASAKSAVRTTISQGPFILTHTGSTIELNGVTYANSTGFWTTTVTPKDLMYAEAGKLYFGAAAADDAYPTTLDLATSEAWTKQ